METKKLDNQVINLLDFAAVVLTVGIITKFGKDATALMNDYRAALEKQPDIRTDGGNDKDFFGFIHKGVRLFAVRNELGKHTLMLPEEY